MNKGKIISIVLFVFILYYQQSSQVMAADLPNNTGTEIKPQYDILVDLDDCRLYLINKATNAPIKVYLMAGGKPSTPSPIGTWKIIEKGKWDKGFGTRWMGLNVPWGKYGIHGTNKPLSIGGPSSLGCIRMLNKDVEELYDKVSVGTPVTIYGGPYNMYTNTFRKLLPGDRGADVMEVQRKMKLLGYYDGALDGLYGDAMKKQVIRLRKDLKLENSHDIDRAFYNALKMGPFE